MLGLNTQCCDVWSSENSLVALSNRLGEARVAIDQAIDYACEIDATSVHVMAGCSDGKTAHNTFVDNLIYACAAAATQEFTILIEPPNM